MTKTWKKKKLKASTILNNFLIITALLINYSCTRYISYQEKVKSNQIQFGAMTCEQSYTQKSDVYLGSGGNTDLFKEYKQKYKLNFFDSVISYSYFQQYLRPDIISPSTRVQIFISYNGKIHYAEGVSSNNQLSSPLFYILEEIKKKLNIKNTSSPLLKELFPVARVEKDFALFLKQKKDFLAGLAGQDSAVRNFYFKGENVLTPNESYPNQETSDYLGKFSKNTTDYQTIFEEIDLNNSKNIRLCSNFSAKEDKDYFSLKEELSQNIRHHHFGIAFSNGDFFLALLSQGEVTSNFTKTPLLLSNNAPRSPWCFYIESKEQNGPPSFALVTSVGQKNTHQVLQAFLRDNLNKPINNFLDRLTDNRFIFISPPLRILSEYLNEEENLDQLEKVPFKHLGISIQQIPIYYQNRVGEIIGIIKRSNFQSFYFDGRSEDRYMTCPVVRAINQ